MFCALFFQFDFNKLTTNRNYDLECEEYAKAVYTQQASPVLLPTAVNNVVSECGIVEVPLIIGGTKSQLKEFPHMVT